MFYTNKCFSNRRKDNDDNLFQKPHHDVNGYTNSMGSRSIQLYMCAHFNNKKTLVKVSFEKSLLQFFFPAGKYNGGKHVKVVFYNGHFYIHDNKCFVVSCDKR